MQATLYYPQIRAYMTEEAQRQTDNASLYRFCALTYDDGPNQWITPHVLDALMDSSLPFELVLKCVPELSEADLCEGDVSPSQLAPLYAAVEEVNPFFMRMAAKVLGEGTPKTAS